LHFQKRNRNKIDYRECASGVCRCTSPPISKETSIPTLYNGRYPLPVYAKSVGKTTPSILFIYSQDD
jgi:hypothetical protein